MEKQIKVNTMVKAGINELKAKRKIFRNFLKNVFILIGEILQISGTFFMPFWKVGSRTHRLILYTLHNKQIHGKANQNT